MADWALLVKRLGLAEAIDRQLHLLKIHLPYHESDHVLNLAYNALCDGTCLEDIELRRNDEVFLDALGGAADSRSDDGRRLLPPLPRKRRADAVGRVSPDAAQSVGRPTGGVLRRGPRRRGRHAGGVVFSANDRCDQENLHATNPSTSSAPARKAEEIARATTAVDGMKRAAEYPNESGPA